jgi:dihydrofolate reductase
MRKLIAAFKTSVDGKIEGPEGFADWVEAWSEDYGLSSQIDACVLGGVEWARFAAQTPHYVLSNTLKSALWPSTKFLRRLGDVADLKQQPGKDIYLMGGARITTSLLDAGLVDEIRLIVYPLIAGKGKSLFATTDHRRGLELRQCERLRDGRLSLIYGQH